MSNVHRRALGPWVLLPPLALLLGAWSWWPFGDDTVASVRPSGSGPYAAASKMLNREDIAQWPFTVKQVMVIASVDCSAFVFGNDKVFALSEAHAGDVVTINGQPFEAHRLDEPGSIWAFDESLEVPGGPRLHRSGLSSVTREALSLIKECG